MKKKSRNLPSNPFYSDEPAVAKSKMADGMPVPNPNLAGKPNKVTDRDPGHMSGYAGFVKKPKLIVKTPKGPSTKIPGTPAPKKPGTPGTPLRMSGHAGAHRLGTPKPPKLK